MGAPVFTTEWQTYTYEGTTNSDGAQTIMFVLNTYANANIYYFDNMSFVVDGEELVSNGDCEGSYSNYEYMYRYGAFHAPEIVTQEQELTQDRVISLNLSSVSFSITYL